MWTVTRQHPYYQNTGAEEPVNIVEVARGDINYTGSGILNPKYDGEGETYRTCAEAVQVAIRIRDQWNTDDPTANAEVGHGNTGGGMFEIEPTDMEDADLIAWAEDRDERDGVEAEEDEEDEDYAVVCDDCGDWIYAEHDNYGDDSHPLCGDCANDRDHEEEEEDVHHDGSLADGV